MMKKAGELVTARWLLGIVVSITVMGGAGWMTYVQGQISVVQQEQKRAEEKQSEQRENTSIIRERVEQLRDGQKRDEEDRKEINRKLEELLRRLR